MRIAVHTAQDPSQPFAEAEVYQRMAVAAGRLGWKCCRTATTREIEAFAPDVVLAEHFSLAKLTSYPTLGLMWNPAAYWGGDDSLVRNVVSYDGHLFADRTTAQFVGDLVSALPVRFVQGWWFPSCQSTELTTGPRAGLAYLKTGWDPGRHREILERIASTTDLSRYGTDASSSPSNALPFDGCSVLSMLSGRAAALCLHTAHHRKTGTPSARVFEAAAAGAVIISDENKFVREAFGETALYVDVEASPDAVAEQVAQHVAWIAANPDDAEELRTKAHKIFRERHTFEILLKQLPDLVADVRRAWNPPIAMADRAVTYIVRTGNRDMRYLRRALTSLECQSHRNIHAIVVAFRNYEVVKGYLAAQRPGLTKITVAEAADTGFRSSAVWTGLSRVETDFYGILDDDDTLLPNHVAACLAALDDRPEMDVAFGGNISVWEDSDKDEPRNVVSPLHFNWRLFRQRNEIFSNAWLARRPTLSRIGADPELVAGEDYYLLLRLQRGANFVPTWRLTAEYRRRIEDPTHSPIATELEESLDRIKRRLQLFDPPFDPPTPPETRTVLTGHDYTAGLIIRRMVKQRHVRKGVQLYLTDIAALPARLARLPGIVRNGGFKELIRCAERRGAAEYNRRAGNR
jgi:phosphoglycerol transferase